MDEKPIVKIRQSSLKTYLQCPEQFRLKHLELVDDTSSDAALTGTATHAGIEDTLLGASPDEAIVRALTTLREGWDEVRHVGTKNLATAETHVLNCYTTWFDNVYPQLGYPTAVEQPFDIKIHDTPEYDVHLTGTIDYGEEDFGLDWKTSGNLRRYDPSFGGEGWQIRRWDVQSTIYTYALTHLFGKEINDFHFVALHRTKPEYIWLDVHRTEEHWAFMLEQARLMAEAIWSDTDKTWMRNNTHALCSDKWCPAYDQCVGAFVSLPSRVGAGVDN